MMTSNAHLIQTQNTSTNEFNKHSLAPKNIPGRSKIFSYENAGKMLAYLNDFSSRFLPSVHFFSPRFPKIVRQN